MRQSWRIGVDTGGTFTDFHVLAPGGALVFKVPSMPADPARAVLEGLARVLDWRERLSSRVSIVHGTTVGTNALLTRQIARTAFVTTAGFEDLVEIGRQNRDSLYDLNADRSPPFVPRELRFGVRERVFPTVSGVESAAPGGRGRSVPSPLRRRIELQSPSRPAHSGPERNRPRRWPRGARAGFAPPHR